MSKNNATRVVLLSDFCIFRSEVDTAQQKPSLNLISSACFHPLSLTENSDKKYVSFWASFYNRNNPSKHPS